MAETQAPSNPQSQAEQIYNVSDSELADRWGIKEPEATEEPEVEEKEVEEKEEVTPEIKKGLEQVEEPEEEEVEVVEEEAEDEPKEEETPKEDKKPPLTKFAVFDDRGELEVPDELKFAFKANGKEYTDVPLEKVVALAQMGIYNHEQQQKVTQTLSEAQQALAERDQLRTALQQYDDYVAKMLTDDNYLEAAREELAKLNAPEYKIQREREQLEEQKQQWQRQQEDQVVGQYTSQRLAPTINALLEQYPSVSHYEVMGRFTEITAPMLVRGRIPVDRLAQVDQAVNTNLAEWVRGVHASRSVSETKRKEDVTSTQRELISTKKAIARKAAPSGKVAPTVNKLKPVKSASDWFTDRFDS